MELGLALGELALALLETLLFLVQVNRELRVGLGPGELRLAAAELCFPRGEVELAGVQIGRARKHFS